MFNLASQNFFPFFPAFFGAEADFFEADFFEADFLEAFDTDFFEDLLPDFFDDLLPDFFEDFPDFFEAEDFLELFFDDLEDFFELFDPLFFPLDEDFEADFLPFPIDLAFATAAFLAAACLANLATFLANLTLTSFLT